MEKIETYLPCFDGFYNTVWEPQEEREIYDINQQRKSKGWKEVDFDDCEFDYDEYRASVVKGIINYLWNNLKSFLSDIEFQKIRSPRFYNFSNDSADVVITLTRENKRAIGRYLAKHCTEFAAYLKKNYTSQSGFISHYPNTVEHFMRNKPLQHKHKLGSILQFIASNEGIESETLYNNVEANLSCVNYHELTTKKRVKQRV